MRNLLRFLVRRALLGMFNMLAVPTHIHSLQEIRFFLIKLLGVKIGCNVQLSEFLYFLNGSNILIKDGVRLGSFAKIWDFCPIELGEGLLASHNLTIISATHDLNGFKDKEGPVIIGRNCWIGANVTIVGPAVIGNDVIIGAGALVRGDLPSSTICAGVPARVIRTR
jgi:maltose O-acetyltransferase